MKRFTNLVVGVDISGKQHYIYGGPELDQFSRTALDKAIWVAERNGAALHVLTTLDVDPHAEALIRRDAASGKRTILDKATERLTKLTADAVARGVAVTTQVALGLPAHALLEDVRTNGRDMVIVGTRARGPFKRRLLDSTALRMLLQAPVPTWIARPGPYHGAEHSVIACIDFDDVAGEILELAESFAEEVGGALHVVHVVDYSAEQLLRAGDADDQMISEYHNERRGDALRRFDEILNSRLSSPNAAHKHLLSGRAAQSVLEFVADVGADVVVIGTSGRRGLDDAFVGDTAERVLPHLDTSLLIVKPPHA
jgi:universal stress protein E